MAESPTGNLLLDALPSREREALLPHLRPFAIPPRKMVIELGVPVHTLYFPRSGMVSHVSSMEDGSTVETATFGREGVVGLPEGLNPKMTPSATSIGQVPAETLALDAGIFRKLMADSGTLQSLVYGYLSWLFNMVGQHASCNRLHPATQRLARWLLMTGDQVGEDQFDLTHEFMGQMLGARRATVTESAQELQSDGFINYSRGHITILDRPGLTGAACECYGLVRQRFDELYSTYRQAAGS